MIVAANAGKKQAWRALFKDSKEDSHELPRSLLKREITAPCSNIDDPAIRQVKSNLFDFSKSVTPKQPKPNMNVFEREGYDWLCRATREGLIAVTEADKGGAIIVTTPQVIAEITNSKLNDTSNYTNLGTSDPLPILKSRLTEMWTKGVRSGFAPPVVGLILRITDPDQPSPACHTDTR